jgi:hypothetical protein
VLTAFPPLHQRIKLALYSCCCNTRITYLQRAEHLAGLALSLPLMPDFDERFDKFLAQMLSFEDQYHTSPHAASYQRTLWQTRLGNQVGIKQGGFCLTSGLLTTPAASWPFESFDSGIFSMHGSGGRDRGNLSIALAS